MAVLNKRFLELVATLVAARLDWLALELMEGVRTGRPKEEREDELARARKAIRDNQQDDPRGEPQMVSEAKPILPDNQIEWGAAHVESRIDELLKQLEASIIGLDLVVQKTIEPQDKRSDGPLETAEFSQNVISVLLTPEHKIELGRDDLTEAKKGLTELRDALRSWVGRSPDTLSP